MPVNKSFKTQTRHFLKLWNWQKMLANFLPLEIAVLNENYINELNLFITKSEKYWKIIQFFLISVSDLPSKYLFKNTNAYSSYLRPKIHEGKMNNLN